MPGGSDIKCAVFDLSGHQAGVAATQVPLCIPKPGFTERPAEAAWEANVNVIAKALEDAGITGGDVAAVGLTGYGNGLVFVDKDLQPVYPAIVSTDERAENYCRKFREDGTDEKICFMRRKIQCEWQKSEITAWISMNGWGKNIPPEMLSTQA